MSEPSRWRDKGPADARALLRGAPKTREMSADQRARGHERLARTTGLLAAAGALAWLQGAALGAGLGVLVVGAVYVAPPWPPVTVADVPARVSAPAPAPVVEATPSPAVASSAPVVSASAEPAPVEPSARPSGGPPAAEEAPAAPRDSLAEEAALIERARAALGPNPAEALAITDVHAAQFAGGKLAMERELVALDALRRLGRASEARARGEALLARAPGGLYEERIRKLLDGAR